MRDEVEGEFVLNWQGPFIVQKMLPSEALVLTEMDGQTFPQPINSDICMKFFI